MTTLERAHLLLRGTSEVTRARCETSPLQLVLELNLFDESSNGASDLVGAALLARGDGSDGTDAERAPDTSLASRIRI